MTLLAIVAIHTAENEPLKIWVWFHSSDFIRLLSRSWLCSSCSSSPLAAARKSSCGSRSARLSVTSKSESQLLNFTHDELWWTLDSAHDSWLHSSLLRRRMKNEWNHTQILRGSFSAVWIATIASKVTFYSIFQALQDKQTFAPFTFQNFSEKTSKFLPEWKWNFIFHSRFSMNFAIFRRNFDENSPEFHRNCQEMTKCIEILRKSATNIRKMLEISGICEKISFFISFFHSCP